MTQWSLGWARGRVNLGANAQNLQQDQQGPQTQGYYERLSLSLSRLQRLSATHTLWANLQGQRSNKNLDSSEEFTLGGSQGVRAYPSAEGTGDHGWLLTLEARQVLTPQWQWITFYDHGQITVNHQSFPGANGPTHASLKGWGTGVSWSLPGRLLARATWSRRIGDNPLANAKTGLDGDGSLVRDRVWLSLTALF
jgi:hemolysin activation/secretion protein